MVEITAHGKIGVAALKAGMHRNTAGKYVRAGALPSELAEPRHWRTREDPFAADWVEIAGRLTDAPELEAWVLLEDLEARKPGLYEAGQLRTLQRRIRQWRAQEGPPKEVFFAQEHRPGEALQTDFTWMNSLGITIGGEPYLHMVCHPVLPYSNWEWGTVCLSESMAALKRGVQEAVFKLGRVPEFHQTDNSTAATHDLASGKRGFNDDYDALMRHLGMKPRTIEIGESHQNGDVESLNGAFKRRVEQHLLMRRSRDFESVALYESWLQQVMEKANRLRAKRLLDELAVMRPVTVKRLPEYTEEGVQVTSWSTIRVKHNTYSVPSRLIGETVRARLYDDRIEIFYAGVCQFVVERLHGRNGHRINYRHIIWWLVQKPGAFARYKYRQDLFPTLTFRKTYDALCASVSGLKADIEYLRILHLAASTMEADVEVALELLAEASTVPLAECVKALVAPTVAEVPEMPVLQVDLSIYDALLVSAEVAA
jgi:hypothetical protein